jgi:hypothetical protein
MHIILIITGIIVVSGLLLISLRPVLIDVKVLEKELSTVLSREFKKKDHIIDPPKQLIKCPSRVFDVAADDPLFDAFNLSHLDQLPECIEPYTLVYFPANLITWKSGVWYSTVDTNTIYVPHSKSLVYLPVALRLHHETDFRECSVVIGKKKKSTFKHKVSNEV